MTVDESLFRGDWPPTPEQRTPAAGVCVVYLAFGPRGRVLYVGKTDDFGRRMGQHSKLSAWPEVAGSWSAISYGTDRATMDREEIELIQTLAPPFNDQHMPRGAAKLRRQARTLASRFPTDRLVGDWRALAVESVTAGACLAVGVVSLVVASATVGWWGVGFAGAGGAMAYGWALGRLCWSVWRVRGAAAGVNRARARADREEILEELSG